MASITYHCAFEPVALNARIVYLNRFQTQKMVAIQKIYTKLISTCLFLCFISFSACTRTHNTWRLFWLNLIFFVNSIDTTIDFSCFSFFSPFICRTKKRNCVIENLLLLGGRFYFFIKRNFFPLSCVLPHFNCVWLDYFCLKSSTCDSAL